MIKLIEPITIPLVQGKLKIMLQKLMIKKTFKIENIFQFFLNPTKAIKMIDSVKAVI